MVRDVENVCKDFLQEFLTPEQNSVGMRVEIDHLGPTLVDMWVDIAATVTEIDRRKVTFEVEVRDALDCRATAGATEVGVAVALVVEQRLPLPHHAERLVVDDGDLDRDALDRAGRQLLVGHLEAAVAVDRPHGRVGPPDLGAHCGGE